MKSIKFAMKTLTKVKIAVVSSAILIGLAVGGADYKEDKMDYLIDLTNFVGKVVFILNNVSPNKQEK